MVPSTVGGILRLFEAFWGSSGFPGRFWETFGCPQLLGITYRVPYAFGRRLQSFIDNLQLSRPGFQAVREGRVCSRQVN